MNESKVALVVRTKDIEKIYAACEVKGFLAEAKELAMQSDRRWELLYGSSYQVYSWSWRGWKEEVWENFVSILDAFPVEYIRIYDDAITPVERHALVSDYDEEIQMLEIPKQIWLIASTETEI